MRKSLKRDSLALDLPLDARLASKLDQMARSDRLRRSDFLCSLIDREWARRQVRARNDRRTD